MTTAGDLIFTGDPEGDFFALDAHTGKKLWSFQTGSGNHGSSVSYEVGERQYVATPSGWGPVAGPLLRLFPELTEAGLPSGGSTIFSFALQEDSPAGDSPSEDPQ